MVSTSDPAVKPDEAVGMEIEGVNVGPAPTVTEMIKGILSLLEKSVKLKDTRLLLGRLLRQTAVFRKSMNVHALQTFLCSSFTPENDTFQFLMKKLMLV
jgi:26S proteasome regulatory subunit N3